MQPHLSQRPGHPHVPRNINSFIPPEILSGILFQVVKHHVYPWICQEDRLQGADARRQNAHRWILCTHVCSYWRDVALQYPVLWSFVFVGLPGSSPASVETMLARAGRSALTVRVDEMPGKLWGNISPLASTLIDNQVHRIQTLIVERQLTSSDFADLIEVTSRNPSLRRLDICRQYIWKLNSSLITDIQSFHSRDRVPVVSIEELSCSGRIPIQMAQEWVSPSLTRLALFNMSGDESLDTLLQLLRLTPALRHLELATRDSGQLSEGPREFAQDHDDPWKTGSCIAVPLPHLRRLVLRMGGCLGPWQTLISHLDFPSTTSISCDVRESSTQPVAESFRVFEEYIARTNSTQPNTALPTQSLLFSSLSKGWYHTSFEVKEFSGNSDPSGCDDPLYSLVWAERKTARFWVTVSSARDIFRTLTKSARIVHNDLKYEIPHQWHDAFAHMVDVETLCVPWSPSLAAALAAPLDIAPTSSYDASSSNSLLFPKLSTLLMYEKEPKSFSSSSWDALEASLLSRARQGGHVRRLMLVTSRPHTLQAVDHLTAGLQGELYVEVEWIEARECLGRAYLDLLK